MNLDLKEKLFKIAVEKIKGDPSHDFEHIRRVTNLAEKIGQSVSADLDVIIPAALFHDVIVYAKDDPRSKNETEESALEAEKILNEMEEYPNLYPAVFILQGYYAGLTRSKGFTRRRSIRSNGRHFYHANFYFGRTNES